MKKDEKNSIKEEKKSKKVKEKKEEKIKEETQEVEEKTIYVERNSGFNTFEVIIIIVISVLFGILVGYFLSASKSKVEGTEVSSELKDLIVTYNSILDNYYDEVDEKELVNAAINGMVTSLEDPYSLYMNDSFTSEFNTTVDGYFVGIGITIYTNEGKNEVVDVNKNGDAYNKLKVGDVIVAVNKKDVTNLTGNDIAAMVKDSKDTVTITVKRNDKERTYKIKKSKIEIDSVSSEVLNDNIGYMVVDNVAANTYKQFKSNLDKLEKKGIDKLIIDVRGNPGGHLKQTSQILDLFFKKNTVLYQVQTREKTTKVKASTNTSRDYPIVIITDANSASAAEIMAACFKENYKNIKIVGETTYGKGTVQKVVDLKSGSSIKYTTQKWLTPKGNTINGVGVKPDVVVERSEEYINNPTRDNDTQLKKAIEIIKQ